MSWRCTKQQCGTLEKSLANELVSTASCLCLRSRVWTEGLQAFGLGKCGFQAGKLEL